MILYVLINICAEHGRSVSFENNFYGYVESCHWCLSHPCPSEVPRQKDMPHGESPSCSRLLRSNAITCKQAASRTHDNLPHMTIS